MAQALSEYKIAAISKLLAYRLPKFQHCSRTPCKNGSSRPYHRSRTCWFGHDQQQIQIRDSPIQIQPGELSSSPAGVLSKEEAAAVTTPSLKSVKTQTEVRLTNAKTQTEAAANATNKPAATQTAPLPSTSEASTAIDSPSATNNAATQSHEAAGVQPEASAEVPCTRAKESENKNAGPMPAGDTRVEQNCFRTPTTRSKKKLSQTAELEKLLKLCVHQSIQYTSRSSRNLFQ